MSIGQFAAEVTSGPIMDSVTASPTKIVDMAKKAADFIADASRSGAGKKPPENPLDKKRKGGEEAKGSEGSGAEDKMGSGVGESAGNSGGGDMGSSGGGGGGGAGGA
ncbi:unnamed protein product [Protopolystoma xenopodis]|uniref:Uncharacterized protein n=1 Tax=Protopolystoma xenopodis TaxID=117903 RepID=A0A448X924_9PLAT|nr:unnamed protein product [Protopolystoma xenopodis]